MCSELVMCTAEIQKIFLLVSTNIFNRMKLNHALALVCNLNKGCTREFLYIRNSNPRLKLALLAEKCAAGMHVNTHSCPLRTEKLTKFHRFLSRLTLTSEGGEWIKKKPRRDFCHLICTWQGRRGWNKRILKQLNCYWQNQKQGSCFRCFFFKKVDNLGILLHFFFWD